MIATSPTAGRSPCLSVRWWGSWWGTGMKGRKKLAISINTGLMAGIGFLYVHFGRLRKIPIFSTNGHQARPITARPFQSVSDAAGGEAGGKENSPLGGKEIHRSHVVQFKTKPQRPLTAKFVANVTTPDRYAAGNGVYLVVGRGREAKSWILRYRFHGRRREMGLGSYPEVGLAEARAAGAEAKRQITAGIDPVDQRKQEKRNQKLAQARNKTFLVAAEEFIAMKRVGPEPWWNERVERRHRCILMNRFKPLHPIPIPQLEAADLMPIVGPPRRQQVPCMTKIERDFAYAIWDHASGGIPEMQSKANPAGKPLDFLLQDRLPPPKPLVAIPYQKIPALYAKLEELSRPTRSYYGLGEACRAVAKPRSTLLNAIHHGWLRATKGENVMHNGIPEEWRIEPADLFKYSPMIIDVIPGLAPVAVHVIKFCILNGCRPSEAREMPLSEYREGEELWVLPWSRMKEGREIRHDLVIPLSPPSVEIIKTVRAIHQRYQIKTDYVFGAYPTRFMGKSATGRPVNEATLLDKLREVLPPEEIKATMHGMRTAIRSWGDDQSYPDGHPRFAEKDLERAIGHIAGFGETEVSRLYSRQGARERPLAIFFKAWADYVTTGGKPAEILPFRRTAGGEP
jgi:hypothetical protein